MMQFYKKGFYISSIPHHSATDFTLSTTMFVSLLQDNPSDFYYFFDSSRRHTCYIAPERFVESSVLNAEGELNLAEEKMGELNPKMDIFSLG